MAYDSGSDPPACFLNASLPPDWQNQSEALNDLRGEDDAGIISRCPVGVCHGYCVEANECDTADVLWYPNFILTVFDWQNLVYLLLVMVIMAVAKLVFRKIYQLTLAKQEGAMAAPEVWWRHATAEPAVLICLAAYIFSASNICYAAISEFESIDKVYPHVGWDTQTTADGFEARVWNILSAILWAAIGLIFMQISQLNVRYLMFRGVDNGVSIVELVTSGITGDDAGTEGSNVAAGIVEGGCIVAAGMVASASIAGAPSSQWGLDLLISLLYFVLAQIFLVLFMHAFDFFYVTGTVSEALQEPLAQDKWLRLPQNQVCKQGNVGVGITFVAMAISFSIHVAQAVYTSFELTNFFVCVLIGGGLQLAARPVLRRLLLWDSKTTDEHNEEHNWGFALVVGSLQIYFARILSSMVIESCADFVYNADYYCTAAGRDCYDDFVRASRTEYAALISHTPCYDDQDVCVSLEMRDSFDDGGWAEVKAASQCQLSASMTLGDRLTETQFAGTFFEWRHVWQVITSLCFLFLAKWLYMLPYWVHAKFSDVEYSSFADLVQDSKHQAVCISFAGYVFGYSSVCTSQFANLRLGELASMFDEDADTYRLEEFGDDILWALVGLVMIFIAEILAHNVVLTGFSNSEELLNRDNRALACIEAGMYIGSGFIIGACITLDNGWLALLFFGLGELMMILFSLGYQYFTKFDDEQSILNKNVASGLHWGLSMASLGLLISRSLYLSQSLITLVVWFGVGAPMLLAVNKIVGVLIFPALSIEDEIYTAERTDSNPLAADEGADLSGRMRGGTPDDVVAEAFARYDADNDGKLTKDECIEMISGLGLSVTRQYLEGVWSVYDTNGDGTLDMEEFRVFYQVLDKRSESAKAGGGDEIEMQEEGEALEERPGVSDGMAAEQGLQRTGSAKRRVHNWGVALVVGALSISMSQLLNTFLRDCAFEFGVH